MAKALECEGWAASWCPKCGDCTCDIKLPTDQLGNDPACLLHGVNSKHALTDEEAVVTAPRARGMAWEVARVAVEFFTRDRCSPAPVQGWTDEDRGEACVEILEQAGIDVMAEVEDDKAEGGGDGGHR